MLSSKIWRAAVLLLLFTSPGLMFARETDLPAARARRIASNPLIDGRLDEEFWTDAPVNGSFIGLGKRQVPPQNTEFRIVYDDEAIIVGITCSEKEMHRLTTNATERDGQVWTDDSVELFLVPGNGFYYQVAVNSAGVIYDGRRPARTDLTASEMKDGLFWVGAWDIGVSIGSDEWSVEIRVPFAMLDAHRGFSDSWRLNVGRTEPRFGFSCWAPVVKGFHDLDRFGYLDGLAVDTAAYVFDSSSLAFPDLRIGRNQLRLTVPATTATGRFNVKTSVSPWMPGMRPARQINREDVGISDGVLDIDLDVAINEALIMNELVIEIADSRTGRPLLLAAHVFRAPKGLEASKPWTVYFGNEKRVRITAKINVTAESLPGRISLAVFRVGDAAPVFQESSRVSRPEEIALDIPRKRLRQDGVYEVRLSMTLDRVGDISERLSFYKHSAPLF